MEKEQKQNLYRIIISIVIYLITRFLISNQSIQIVLYIAAYLISGYDVLLKAVKRISKFEAFDETILMSIATIGAFIIGEYQEAVFVMVFYQIGELFQDYSVDKSKDNLRSLLDINSDFANVERNGAVEKVNPEEVNIGDIIVINPHEKIPIDGEVVDGNTMLNTSALTGESIPRYVSVGDLVVSGLINNEHLIKVKTTKKYSDSTASKIIELVQNATNKKSKSENFISSFAKVYTPVVCLIALFTFIIPVLFNILVLHTDPAYTESLYRALTILVISCPCAILISVPLAFFSSIGNASKNGILVKGTNYLEVLSKVKNFVFDKTGTMTKGVFEVVGIHHCIMDEKELVKIVAHVENFSNHPIAKSIVKYYNAEIDPNMVKDVTEIGGRGLSAYVDGKLVLVGNDKLMKENNIDYKECHSIGTVVHVAFDGSYEGHILVSDIIKSNAKVALAALKSQGVNKTIMLSGDREVIAKAVANEIGIDECLAPLLPDDKLNNLERYISENKTAFVGDGINDAPCISRADVGIAMGAIGSASAIDLADLVIMDDDIMNVAVAHKISKRTMRVVYENMIFSISVKFLILILSIFGITNMWLAIFADVGIMVIAVINSVRLLYMKNKHSAMISCNDGFRPVSFLLELAE